jgi:histidine ammonia-lyase
MLSEFKYGSDFLSVGIALDIAKGRIRGIISDETKEIIKKSRKSVEEIVNRKVTVYGINTGFGPLCTSIISPEDTAKLQYNLLISHSVGVGDYIDDELAKLMMIVKVHALAKGYSGIQLSTVERILWHIENNIIPKVPCQGSVGASGDLAPLAHLFLPLIGLGKVSYKGEIADTATVLRSMDFQPIQLGAKEGLALINGTQFMAAHGIKIVERLANCLDAADIIGAMSLEALLGSVKPFEAILHEIRPFNGNKHVAERLRTMLKDSEILDSHIGCSRVQDPYSLRCMPQVHGASRNAWLHLKEMIQIEINSVTDNPIVVDADHTYSGGNFHGQPIALPLDYAAMAASEVGNISDRRSYLLLEGKEGLPLLLMKNTGLNSGFMIPQYTSAALVSENKTLCFPASVDSIPTSLGQEDHVSMGSISGRKSLKVVENLEKILAIELLSASQAFDYRRPLRSGILLEACHNYVRKFIHHAEEDRVFGEDIQACIHLISSKKLVSVLNETAKTNHENISEYEQVYGIY